MSKYTDWLIEEREKALRAELEAIERRKAAIMAELKQIISEEKGAAPR
jgi:hypothetical protein